jgi:hypothetical protein
VAFRRLIVIVIALNTSGAALVLWSCLTIESRENKLRPARDFPERHLGPRRDIEGVGEEVFGDEGAGQALAASRRADLDGYRWVDRSKRTVQIPVTEAMAIVVERAATTPREKAKP